MGFRRRRSGLKQVGRLSVDELGLSRRRACELRLQAAWVEVAGEAIAQRAEPVRIARGVLELAVEDERWIASLRDLVPRLAGRLSARYPELGVRRFRLKLAGQSAEAPVAVDAHDDPPRSRPPVEEPEEASVAEESALERLERVSERYLQRSEDRR